MGDPGSVLADQQRVASKLAATYVACRMASSKAWGKLSEDQRIALLRYRSSGFDLLNRLLRNETDRNDQGMQWFTVKAWLTQPIGAERWAWHPTNETRWVSNRMLDSMALPALPMLIRRVEQEAVRCATALDDLFAKVAPRTTLPMTVFRGVRGEFASRLLALKRKERLSEHGYLSTTVSPQVARSFMGSTLPSKKKPKKNKGSTESSPRSGDEDNDDPPGKSCMMLLRLPKGTPFIFLDSISGDKNDRPWEMEMLLPRGLTLEVAEQRTEVDINLEAAMVGHRLNVVVIDASMSDAPSVPERLPDAMRFLRLYPESVQCSCDDQA